MSSDLRHLERLVRDAGPVAEAVPLLVQRLREDSPPGAVLRRLLEAHTALVAREGTLNETLLEALLTAEPASSRRNATGRTGVVAAGAMPAAEAGAALLAAGGNAVDAAVGTCLALTVADPPNVSLFGRCHVLVRTPDWRALAWDGATQAPESLRLMEAWEPPRQGYATVPVPGLPKTLLALHQALGKLPLPQVVEPARHLAEAGFVVPPRLAALWARRAHDLAEDAGATHGYLQPGGEPWHAGECFRQPTLARLLTLFGHEGAALFEQGDVAEAVEAHVTKHAGFLTREAFRAYRPEPAEVLSARYRDCEVWTNAGSTWGHSLVQMVHMLDALPGPHEVSDADWCAQVALVILTAFADRPQELSTLQPKPDGLPLATLADPAFAAERAGAIRRLLAGPPEPLLDHLRAHLPAHVLETEPEDQDTTHLSVMDAQGWAVSLSASIGPHFGVRCAVPDVGVLLPNSYRMAHAPLPGVRDQTEMTPALLVRNGNPVAALGGAGSERIPGAVVQVLANLVDRQWPLDRAVAAPRVNWKFWRLRVHLDWGHAVMDGLAGRGFPVQLTSRGNAQHLGVVHAVARQPDGTLAGAADPAYDGGVAVV